MQNSALPGIGLGVDHVTALVRATFVLNEGLGGCEAVGGGEALLLVPAKDELTLADDGIFVDLLIADMLYRLLFQLLVCIQSTLSTRGTYLEIWRSNICW